MSIICLISSAVTKDDEHAPLCLGISEGVDAETERRERMSKKSKRIAMILVVVVMAFLAVAQHFGWIAGPPPLLAPGVQ